MSSFTSKLELKLVEGGLILLKPLTFYYNDDLTGNYITIPEGYFFNGASIPTIFQKLFKFDPLNPYWIAATIVHDALVGEFNYPLRIQPENRTVSWREATDWFDQALRVKHEQYGNCPYFYRKLFVTSVKFYGIFRKDR